MKDLGGVGKIRAGFPRLITDRDDIIKVFVFIKIKSFGFLTGYINVDLGHDSHSQRMNDARIGSRAENIIPISV